MTRFQEELKIQKNLKNLFKNFEKSCLSHRSHKTNSYQIKSLTRLFWLQGIKEGPVITDTDLQLIKKFTND